MARDAGQPELPRMRVEDDLPYRVEIWSADALHLEETLAATGAIDLARLIFSAVALRLPHARLALRCRSRVIDERLPADR